MTREGPVCESEGESFYLQFYRKTILKGPSLTSSDYVKFNVVS